MDVINKIENLRNERNWSKYKLAEEAMINYSTLSAMYTRDTPPKIEILEMLCNAFGISLAQFFADENDSEFLNERERELLRRYRKLSDEKKNAIFTLTDN